MSTPADLSENGGSSGRKRGRSPEKSSFSHTCNLLSKYLKEKGSFGDLRLGITCNLDDGSKGKSEAARPTATMDLLPRMEISGDKSERKGGVSDRNVKSMDLFPQLAGFGPSEDSGNSGDMRPNAEPEKAQMTIFYGGRVHVFNGFPADKAREVMLLASSGVPQQQPAANERRSSDPPKNTRFVSASVSSSASGSNPTQANGLDLPIARKVSLHRFLEKRKERISSKAPYKLQKEESDPIPSKKTESSKSWLGLTSLKSS